LCLVELRGFEPLTSCMPSREPQHDAHHEPQRHRAIQQHKEVGLVMARVGSSGWVAALLLPAQRLPTRAAAAEGIRRGGNEAAWR
jgi:hypothetical protein